MSENFIIRTNGNESRASKVEPANGHDFTLEEMQEIVGGYIEYVYLVDGDVMVVNEEGLLEGLPINPDACIIADRQIVGTVLVCGPVEAGIGTNEEDEEDFDQGPTEEQVHAFD